MNIWNIHTNALGAVLLIGSLLTSIAQAGPGASGGGDNVEPLFIQAKKDAQMILNPIKDSDIDQLSIDQPYKDWLKAPVAGLSRLNRLKFYVEQMRVVFQEEPCQEAGAPRGACFDNNDQNDPKMIVSRSYNKATTPDQAIALVYHEAGHFTGEMDHLFLSSLGSELTSLVPVSGTLISNGGCSINVNIDPTDRSAVYVEFTGPKSAKFPCSLNTGSIIRLDKSDAKTLWDRNDYAGLWQTLTVIDPQTGQPGNRSLHISLKILTRQKVVLYYYLAPEKIYAPWFTQVFASSQ